MKCANYPILQFRKAHYRAKASLRAHYSKISAFHHSSWGEAPNLFHIRFKIWQQNANNIMMGSIDSKSVHRIPFFMIAQR